MEFTVIILKLFEIHFDFVTGIDNFFWKVFGGQLGAFFWEIVEFILILQKIVYHFELIRFKGNFELRFSILKFFWGKNQSKGWTVRQSPIT